MALRLDVNTLTGPQTAGKELIISQPSVSLSLLLAPYSFVSPFPRLPPPLPAQLPPVLPSPLQSPVLRCDLITAAWRSMPPVAGGSIALNYGFISAHPHHAPPSSHTHTHTHESSPSPHLQHHLSHTYTHSTPTNYSQSRSIPYNLIFIHFSINPEIAFICRIRQAK